MTFKIPLFKVLMAPNADVLLRGVLQSGHIAQGPRVDAFEAQLAEFFEVPASRVVTVNSGTSALHLAYHLAGVKPGDAVIATPMTCSATITPLVHLGAQIVWADVHPTTGNIDPMSVGHLLDGNGTFPVGRVRAVAAVDWAGRPADYRGLREVVPLDVPIIEDAAHAFGAQRPDRESIAAAAGYENVIVCYSFQAIKHLTTGDGGALVCPTDEMAERARKLRWFGLDRRSSKDFRCAQEITEAGYKFHMNDLAATLGIANLDLAKIAVDTHRRNAEHYASRWRRIGVSEGSQPASHHVVPPPPDPGSAWWLYTLLVEDRQGFQAFMAERGIETSQVHRRNDEHPAFPMRSPVSLAGLDYFSSHQVSIPVHWALTTEELEHVADAVASWVKG